MNAPYQGLPGLLCLDCYRTLVNKYLFSTYWHQKPPMIQKITQEISILYSFNVNFKMFTLKLQSIL